MITNVQPMSHPALPGVRVFPKAGTPKKGEPQEVLVEVDPYVEIPLHLHKVDASMWAVAGTAEVLSVDPEVNGKIVGPGSCVMFEKNIPHGFRAGPNGFAFLSRNGGIVDEGGDWDMTFRAA